jgi:putative tricarboxylic transport membrane protein
MGFSVALAPINLGYCLLGVFLGTFVGVLPGIGASAAVAMLLPISFYLEPTTALVMLAGVYYGAEYGGATASILLNLPGTSSNAVTCIDGHAMTRNGQAGLALMAASLSSFFGGCIGILIMIFLTPLVVSLTLSFGPSEYFAAMLFGLIAAGSISKGNPFKGLAMVTLGVAISFIGIDINSGVSRFTFGFFELEDGVKLVVIAMGLFGVAEVISSINSRDPGLKIKSVSMRSMIPRRDDVARSFLPAIRGSSIGSFFGALPATGPTLSAFMSYSVEKRLAKDKDRFGSGAIEGVVGPESANNAAAQTSFIPTLALGIPGSATMAIMIGGMMIHGIAPGPRFISEHPDIFWGLIASFWIGNALLLILNIPLIGFWVRILRTPYRFLHPAIITLICIGVYGATSNIFDVWLLLIFGFFGYMLRLLSLEPAPLLIGFVLGPMIEENFRRALLLANGNYLSLLERPIALSLLIACLILFLWLTLKGLVRTEPIENSL